MVGSPQDIQCTVSTVDGVQPHLLISWVGPRGDTIITNSRLTITPTTSIGNDYSSTLQFAYLMEGDEGMYICSVMILETSASGSVMLGELTGKLFFMLHISSNISVEGQNFGSNCRHSVQCTQCCGCT